MLAHNDAELSRAIEARWGKCVLPRRVKNRPTCRCWDECSTKARATWKRGTSCLPSTTAVCHTLFGEGNKVGPDLTTADRKNRDALLLNILDPSGYVRPEYVAQTAVLNDGRVLVGLVIESTAQQVTLVDAKNQKTIMSLEEIEEIKPSAQSLMPERLLETLAPQEVRDLFRYLQSAGPAVQAARSSRRGQRRARHEPHVLRATGASPLSGRAMRWNLMARLADRRSRPSGRLVAEPGWQPSRRPAIA